MAEPVDGQPLGGHDECTAAQCGAACAYGRIIWGQCGHQTRGECAVALWMSDEQ